MKTLSGHLYCQRSEKLTIVDDILYGSPAKDVANSLQDGEVHDSPLKSMEQTEIKYWPLRDI